MEALDRRPATTKEFRAALNAVLGDRVTGIRYTDKSRGKDTDKRYVAVMERDDIVSDKDLHNVEAALWMVGATANTRRTGGFYVRGTCVIA